MPESPKWLHSIGRYKEARESLYRVALFNGTSVDLVSQTRYDDFVFEQEVGIQAPHYLSDSELSRGNSFGIREDMQGEDTDMLLFNDE